MKSTRRGSDSPVHRREKTPRFQIPLDKWPVSPGTPSRQSRGMNPPVEIRRGAGAQRKWCREPRSSSRGRPVCWGTFWVASRVPSTVLTFKTELGTSLEMLSRERASSCDGRGTTCFFSSCGGILELRRGIQDASFVGPGKSNLPFEV